MRVFATRPPATMSSWLARFVFAHDIVSAVHWMVVLVIAAGAAVYARIGASDLVLGIAIGAGAVMVTCFLRWLARSEAEKPRLDLERQLETERRRGDRQTAALDVIGELSRSPLAPGAVDEQMENWLANLFLPVVQKLIPEVGLGVVRSRDGEDRLVSDLGVPDVVRRQFPMRTDRHLSNFLATLQLENSAQVPIPTTSDRGSAGCLLIFPGSALDEPTKAVFAVGAQMISDARTRGTRD